MAELCEPQQNLSDITRTDKVKKQQIVRFGDLLAKQFNEFRGIFGQLNNKYQKLLSEIKKSVNDERHQKCQ